jgi:cysteine-rich repeat protein
MARWLTPHLGWASLLLVTVEMTPAICGNGVIDATEQCDDGNADSRGWCSADCSEVQGAQQVLYASGHSAVYAIDVATRDVIATIPLVTPFHSNLQASPDGKYLAVVTIGTPYDNVVVIETAGNTVAATIPLGRYVEPNALAFSPDSRTLYLHNGYSHLIVVDMESMSLRGAIDAYLEYEAPDLSPGNVEKIAVAGSGRSVFLVTNYSAVLTVVDLTTGFLRPGLFGDPTFNEYPDGTYVSFVVSNDDRTVYGVFDYSYTWFSALDTRTGHYQTIYEDGINATTLQLSCDEQSIFAVVEDGFARIDPESISASFTSSVSGMGSFTRYSALARDGGTFFYSGDNGNLYWIDTETKVSSDFGLDTESFDGIALVTMSSRPSPCTPSPRPECRKGFAKAQLSVNEKTGGREQLIAKFGGGPAISQAEFGNPIHPPCGSTAYSLCLYSGNGDLAGQIIVDRAGYRCSDGADMCWSSPGGAPPAGRSLNYRDKANQSDGVSKLLMKAGGSGKSRILLKASNNSDLNRQALPTGIAATLSSASSSPATMQLVTNDAGCFSATLSTTRRADSAIFRAFE